MLQKRLEEKKGYSSESASIGILQSNSSIFMPPGDVGNPVSFSFPVIYQVVEELTSDRLIVHADPTLAEPIIREARKLEEKGVSAITGDCGHLIQFQKGVAAAVHIPVFLSSWLQIPFIAKIIHPDQQIGVLMANSAYLRMELLKNAGINESMRMIVAGMENQPAFRAAVIEESGDLDFFSVEREVVGMARRLKQDHPDIGAFFLECSDMPPYAAAIQDAVQLPVFDFITMINFVHASLNRTGFINPV